MRNVETMDPRLTEIATKDEITVVGMRHMKGQIMQLWQEFLPRSVEIKNSLDKGVFYGFQGMVDGSDSVYIACTEVSTFDDVPEGMVSWTIPAGKYAVFTCKGIPESLDDTFDEKLYTNWLPSAELEPSANYYVEIYDQRFRPGSEDSEVDLWVPVK